MHIDTFQQEPNASMEYLVERSKPMHMEEDLESIDKFGLDILGVEQACRNIELYKIIDRQLESLEFIISRAHQQRSLGIQLGSQWNGKSIPKDTKK